MLKRMGFAAVRLKTNNPLKLGTMAASGIAVAERVPLHVGQTIENRAYLATKAAIVNLTRGLALEWARHGIRVNALAPGYIVTDFNREFLEGPAGEGIRKRVPQRRFGTPEDLDGPLLLLCSAASAHMTGTALVVDGGHTARL